MAITLSIVRRLILEYIGGTKVWGNPVSVFADQQKVVIQRQFGLLSSLSSFLRNPLSSIGQMLPLLTSNPVSGILGNITGQLSSFMSAATAIGLPGGALSTLTAMAGNVTTAISDMQLHTDTLSGLVYDLETVAATKPTLSDMMMMPDPAQAVSMASALFSDNQLSSIANSLNPSVPGGVSGLLSNLASATTDGQKTDIVNSMCKMMQDHINTMEGIISSDESAYNTFQTNQSMETLLIGMTPAVNNKVFQRVATSAFKEFTGFTSSNM